MLLLTGGCFIPLILSSSASALDRDYEVLFSEYRPNPFSTRTFTRPDLYTTRAFSTPDSGRMLREPLPENIDNNEVSRDTVPEPTHVMRRSMIVPGWGQVVNRQVWKVPIIYGMLAGLAYYSILMDQNYRDYRAAYFNVANPGEEPKFGPTPGHIDPNLNPESLRYNRNFYRNRRDMTFIGIVLAYGLNIVDAYVFAHMRDFDVSDDLSASMHVGSSRGVMAVGDFSGDLHSYHDSTPVNMTFTLRLNFP